MRSWRAYKLLIALLIVSAGLLFVDLSEAKAESASRCCVLKEESGGYRGPWIPENKRGQPHIFDTRGAFTPNVLAPVNEATCRYKPGSGCVTQGRCVAETYTAGGDWLCSSPHYRKLVEREVDCATDSVCRESIQLTKEDCASRSEAECRNAFSSTCFWYGGQCLGRDNGRVCGQIVDSSFCGVQPDGGKSGSRVCAWKNNRCFSPLEAGLSTQYDTEDPEKRGKFLPPCALGGTCRDANDLVELVLNSAGVVLKLIGGLAFVMFIVGGVQMILSFGNPEKFKAGQKRLFFAVIGISLALSAFLLVNFILTALGVEPAFRAIG